MKDYKTASGEAFYEFVEKKSRFLSYLAPVSSEAEATAFLSKISSMHREATHVVYAYSLLDGQIKRYSDDGEPSGTAGMPTLEVLTHKEIYNVAIATVRYFGGTLLGTGGLTRAYSKGASDVVSAANIITRTYGDLLSLVIPYTLYGKINTYLSSQRVVITESDFGETVSLKVFSPISETEALCRELIDISAAKVEISPICRQFLDI